MTHHTSDSWPIYGVTCSISIKHITAPSPRTSPITITIGGKYELIIFWSYAQGREEGDDLAVKERITGAPLTHIKHSSNSCDAHINTHSDKHTLSFVHCLFGRHVCYIHVLDMYVCMSLQATANSLHTTSFQSMLMASMCCASVVRITFSIEEEGQPNTVASPKMSPSTQKATIEKGTINHSAKWGHTFLVWVTPVGNTILLRIIQVWSLSAFLQSY